VNGETRNLYLQSSSARVRTAILRCLDNMQLPPNFSKDDMVVQFTELFRIVLPGAGEEGPQNAVALQVHDDALDILCARLDERQLLHRCSDREMMHRISDITQNITLLDDPSGRFTAPTPRVYVLNCHKCHFAGDTQLRFVEDLKLPVSVKQSIKMTTRMGSPI